MEEDLLRIGQDIDKKNATFGKALMKMCNIGQNIELLTFGVIVSKP